MRFLLLVSRYRAKLLVIGCILLIVFFLFKITTNSIDDDEEWYKHPSAYFSEVNCNWDDYSMNLFGELAQRMDDALSKLGIIYFLCYGSLWGALKFEKTLPWDRNIDMCVIHHQIATIDENTIHTTFKKAGLNYYYNSRKGKYVVSYKGVTGEITIFEKVGAHAERVGWEKRIFPHLYLDYQRFPYSLIEKDLTKVKFHDLKLPVPHDSFEIQKYFYPENWWKEVKPKGCLE